MPYNIGPKIGIDGEAQFRQQVNNINASLRALASEMKVVQSSYAEGDKSAEKLTQENEVLIKQLEQLRKKQEEARKAVSDARREHGEASSVTQKWQRVLNDTTAEINNLDRQLAENNEALSGNARVMQDNVVAIDSLSAALAAAGIAKGVKEIAAALRDCVGAAIEFESAITGVYKTVDGTDDELQGIADGIKELSTTIPLTTTELAGIAEAAGQLGIATDDILSFTEVMAKLGVTTNLSSEEAATAIARFANITGTSAADYERLGSTIVALGNNFATTESEITEMATRLASAGELAGLTESDILALSAAMSSVGINAEAGGTAMTQTLSAIEKAAAKGGDDLEAFAKIAGMSATQFKQAWNTNAISALQAFIAGLGGLEEQGENATLVLEDLGLSGIRQSNMLKSLALASETLAGAIDLSSNAWRENSALASEASLRFETTESKLALLSNSATLLKQAIGDVLLPALGELAAAGADSMKWATDFIRDNEWVVAAVTALAAALGVLAVAAGGFTVAVNIAIPAVTAFNAALAANPIGAVVLGLAAAAAAVVALVTVLSSSNAELQNFREGLRGIGDAQAEADKTTLAAATMAQTYIERLRKLEEQGLTTADAQDKYAETVALLNKTIPDLNVTIDEQTGLIKGGTDALWANTEAWKENALAQALQTAAGAYAQTYADALLEQTKAQLDLTEASLQYDAAMSRLIPQKDKYEKMLANGIPVTREFRNEYNELVYETEQWADKQRDATDAVELATEKVAEAEKAFNSYTDAANSATSGTEEFKDETKSAADENENQIETIQSLTKATNALTGENDRLTEALAEQKTAGTLNLNTINELIDAGYALALQIDAETGNVTLNKDAYIALATAKIEEQIATAKTNRSAVITQLNDEAKAAVDVGLSYLSLAASKIAGSDDVRTFDVQIAALEKLRDGLGKTAKSTGDYGNTAAKTAEKVETAAEKALKAYQTQEKELKHLREIGLISEAEYYDKLADLRDTYLTDESALDKYRDVNEQIFKYQAKMLEENAKAFEASMSAIEKTFADTIADLERQIADAEKEVQAMYDRLADYGDLFEIDKETGGVTLSDLQAQIDAINEYGRVLEELESKGVSKDLVSEIAFLNVDDAIAYGNELLGMGEDALDEYVAMWEEKQKAAREVAEKYYEDEISALKEQYDEKLEEALGVLRGTALTSGENTIQALIDGMKENETALYETIQGIIDNASAMFAEGLGEYGQSALDLKYPDMAMNLAPDTNQQTADLINALGTLLTPTSAGGAEGAANAAVYLDGIEVGRILLPSIREIDSASPEVRSDF